MANFEAAFQEMIKFEGGNPQLESSDGTVLCSECFHDQGLRLNAEQIGIVDDLHCPNCGSKSGRKLSRHLVSLLAEQFFVCGTIKRYDFGAAPRIQFNSLQTTEIKPSPWFEADVHLIEKSIDVGFFYYSPSK